MSLNTLFLDEEPIEVLRQEWLDYYAPLDFRHPSYIDWEDFCLKNGFSQEQINREEEF